MVLSAEIEFMVLGVPETNNLMNWFLIRKQIMRQSTSNLNNVIYGNRGVKLPRQFTNHCILYDEE